MVEKTMPRPKMTPMTYLGIAGVALSRTGNPLLDWARWLAMQAWLCHLKNRYYCVPFTF